MVVQNPVCMKACKAYCTFYQKPVPYPTGPIVVDGETGFLSRIMGFKNLKFYLFSLLYLFVGNILITFVVLRHTLSKKYYGIKSFVVFSEAAVLILSNNAFVFEILMNCRILGVVPSWNGLVKINIQLQRGINNFNIH